MCKKLQMFFLALLVMILVVNPMYTQASSYFGSENGFSIKDGFVPPKNITIVHSLNTASKAYTKVANKVQELYVGEHHRFTVAANKRKKVAITWAVSNKNVAAINKRTGELTALAAGKVTVTMKDTANNAQEKFTILIKVNPVFPEIPKEWYTVKAERRNNVLKNGYESESIDGVCLELKSEYADLYAQCSMLKIPAEIDGKPVIDIVADFADPEKRYSIFVFSYGVNVFSSLKYLQTTELITNNILDEYVREGKSQGVEIFYDGENIINICGYSENNVHIPETVKSIRNDVFLQKMNVRIPASVKWLYHDQSESGYDGFDFYQASYSVDGNNTNYYSIFGVLYSYTNQLYSNGMLKNDWTISSFAFNYSRVNRSCLMTYPKTKTDKVFYVPDGVERIEEGAFQENEYLEKIVLSDSVREIGRDAFAGLKKNVEIVIPAGVTNIDSYSSETVFGFDLYEDGRDFQNITIVTPKGSTAEAYAKKYHIKYRNK